MCNSYPYFELEIMKLNIPTDYTEFLYWIKERTETFWSKNPETSDEEFPCEKWAYGAKWIGLSDSEIDSIENKYNIKFSYEHREFLRVLHTIDRKEIIEYEPFDEDDKVKIEHVPFFYNWLTDDKEIQYRLDWSYRTIFEDVIGPNKVWLKSWGSIRPKSDSDKEKIFSEWFQKTPKILPITSHRFVVDVPSLKENPVLSIYGSDIIVYGWNMRHYLLNELRVHLNLFELVYDEEDDEWYYEQIKELQEINNFEYGKAKDKIIPIWEEMILYWSSGWSSYGKEKPNTENEIIQPIVKTFIAQDEEEEEENFQKIFNVFDKKKSE